MNRTQIIALVLLSTSLIRCNPKFGRDGEEVSSDWIMSKNPDSFVKIETEPTSLPEKYVVYIGWPRLDETKRFRIRLDKTLIVVGSDQSTFHHEVRHSQNLTYVFDVLGSNDRVERTFSRTVVIPEDLVIGPTNSTLSQDETRIVKRLFLTADSPLTTSGFNFKVIADQIISESGVIQTFPDNSKASPDIEGRTAGAISIESKFARGSLAIYMRGEHGGDGSKGPSHSTRAAQGRQATGGSEDCSDEPHFLKILSVKKPLKCRCIHQGDDGTDGETGAKGFTGYPAKNGGSSGVLRVSIVDGNDFSLTAFNLPGKAGAPGLGGDGQPGGFGGEGGTRSDCIGRPGREGKTGPIGDPGGIAVDGDVGVSCIYIASTQRNECNE